MSGRDPHETHRVATPLELLFDLTFATSFGLAASHLAEALAAGRYAAAALGFGFASFAICWAWINFQTVLEASPSRSNTEGALSVPVDLYLLRTWIWHFDRIYRP